MCAQPLNEIVFTLPQTADEIDAAQLHEALSTHVPTVTPSLDTVVLIKASDGTLLADLLMNTDGADAAWIVTDYHTGQRVLLPLEDPPEDSTT